MEKRHSRWPKRQLLKRQRLPQAATRRKQGGQGLCRESQEKSGDGRQAVPKARFGLQEGFQAADVQAEDVQTEDVQAENLQAEAVQAEDLQENDSQSEDLQGSDPASHRRVRQGRVPAPKPGAPARWRRPASPRRSPAPRSRPRPRPPVRPEDRGQEEGGRSGAEERIRQGSVRPSRPRSGHGPRGGRHGHPSLRRGAVRGASQVRAGQGGPDPRADAVHPHRALPGDQLPLPGDAAHHPRGPGGALGATAAHRQEGDRRRLQGAQRPGHLRRQAALGQAGGGLPEAAETGRSHLPGRSGPGPGPALPQEIPLLRGAEDPEHRASHPEPRGRSRPRSRPDDVREEIEKIVYR